MTYVPDCTEQRTFRRQDTVSLERLEAVAAMYEEPKPSRKNSHYQQRNGDHRLLVDKWLTERGYEFTTKPFNDERTGYLLSRCPFDENHGKTARSWSPRMLMASCPRSGCTIVALDGAGRNSSNWTARTAPLRFAMHESAARTELNFLSIWENLTRRTDHVTSTTTLPNCWIRIS